MRARQVDSARLAAAASRPGIDPTRWVAWAVVEDVGFDPQHGHFADVRYLDDGTPDTAIVGTGYAGGGFGMSLPLKVGDTVLVAVPSGDPGWGPVVVCRRWDSGDPPPAATGAGQEPARHAVLVVEGGQDLQVGVSGAGKVRLGEVAASRQAAFADRVLEELQKVKADYEALRAWVLAHVHTGVTTGAGSSGAPVPAGYPSPHDPQSVACDKVAIS